MDVFPVINNFAQSIVNKFVIEASAPSYIISAGRGEVHLTGDTCRFGLGQLHPSSSSATSHTSYVVDVVGPFARRRLLRE